MNDPRKDRFGPYLRCLADLMGLRDWTLEIDAEPPGGTSNATVRPLFGRKYAILRFSEDFLAAGPECQRQTCVHELVHLHVAPASEVAEDLLDDPAGRCYRRLIEYAVDGIAEAWAGTLPLPGDRHAGDGSGGGPAAQEDG